MKLRWRQTTAGGQYHAFDSTLPFDMIKSKCFRALTEKKGLKREACIDSISPVYRCTNCVNTINKENK